MNVIKKFQMKKSEVTGDIVRVMVFGTVAIFLFIMIANTHEFWGDYYIEDVGKIDSGTYVLMCIIAIFSFILAVETILRGCAASKNCLSICDDRIVGISFKFGMLFSEQFDVKYSDILNVNMNGKFIKVETAMKTHTILIDDKEEAYQMLFERVKK